MLSQNSQRLHPAVDAELRGGVSRAVVDAAVEGGDGEPGGERRG
jgi:hypothetical protein